MKRGLLNTTVVVLGLMAFVAIAAYWFSIPWRTFNYQTEPAPKMIQSGPINEVWISNEGKGAYVHVTFTDGTERKCTISTVGLFRSAGEPTAMIGKINHGYQGWDHVAMDVGLPSDAYWRLRLAGWTPWRHSVRIDEL